MFEVVLSTRPCTADDDDDDDDDDNLNGCDEASGEVGDTNVWRDPLHLDHLSRSMWDRRASCWLCACQKRKHITVCGEEGLCYRPLTQFLVSSIDTGDALAAVYSTSYWKA